MFVSKMKPIALRQTMIATFVMNPGTIPNLVEVYLPLRQVGIKEFFDKAASFDLN